MIQRLAVCLSRIHDDLNIGYLNELDRLGQEIGGEVVAYHFPGDAEDDSPGREAARALFRAMDWDSLSAVAVIAHSFHDDPLFEELIAAAETRGIPLISIGQRREGCYSIVNENESAMKELVRHVIRDHGARETFFIAGRRGEENSELRLRCYHETLAELGLPFSMEQVAWADYRPDSAANIALSLVQSGNPRPRAILCANDNMAIAVCDALQGHGLRVPEDVIVTGFDAIPFAQMVHPRLTTVGDSPLELARQTWKLVYDLRDGRPADRIMTHPFHPVFSESCGCAWTKPDRYDAPSLYRRLETQNAHENHLYHNVERMLTQSDPQLFLALLAHTLLADSAVYLNEPFVDFRIHKDHLPSRLGTDLTMIPACPAEETPRTRRVTAAELLPPPAMSKGITVVSPIWSAYVVFGCYVARTRSLSQDSQLIKRLSDVLNLVYAIRLGNARHSRYAANLYNDFNLLMDKRLFRFHFQPIVDAKNGRIVAYEALMRTAPPVNLSPLQVLNVAREYHRLGDVERATFFGIMDRYAREANEFRGRKVFINTIPGHLLSPRDCQILIDRYGEVLDRFVFEVTEQDTIPEEELARLRGLCRPGGQTLIAIDDYGAGHSNIVNVLRYQPQVIKIDRELISGVESDANKQLFVRNTIDFAHRNGIQTLAEGVETAAELRTVIDYGVDLIQGYYTGRPAEQPIPVVEENVRREILEENLQLASLPGQTRIYKARDGEALDLYDLALQQYSVLALGDGAYTCFGQGDQPIDLVIRVADHAKADLTFQDVSLRGREEPALQLGDGSQATLTLEGTSALKKNGIRVPGSALLTLRGDGSLQISSTNQRGDSIGIGAGFTEAYGGIRIDMDGTLEIRASGDKAVCLGGGRSAGEGIHLLRGTCRLTANAVFALGLGSAEGNAAIEIGPADVNILAEGNDAVALGTLSGRARIRSTGRCTLTVNSERATGLGALSGSADIGVSGGTLAVTVRCDAGVCVGSLVGEATALLQDTEVSIHGEGNRLAGFGSLSGAGETRVESGFLRGELLAGERLYLGNDRSRMVITGGNFQIYPENGQYPVTPDGQPLFFFTPKEDHFESAFQDSRESWTYVAERTPEGHLGVFIPGE